MAKLKLSLNELQVESFHATGQASLRGTVPGHEWTEHADESCFGTCDGNCTRYGSCEGGCGTGVSCNGTCFASCGCPPGTGATECGCQTIETCPGAPICS